MSAAVNPGPIADVRPGPPRDPVVDARDLTKTYRARRRPPILALDAVDLRVDSGERVAILGPNGSGKTTLLSVLAGTTRPDTGTCSILGDPGAGRAGTRARVGVVFQSPGLDPLLTVRENLKTHARVCGLDRHCARAAASGVMDDLGLGGRADDRVGTLSGGLARRVDLARAMLPVHPDGPGLLLLDEPTVGLDPSARAGFRLALDRMGDAHPDMAIVMTTHLFEDAEWCARAVLMSDGRVVGDGAPEALTAGLGALAASVVGLGDAGAIEGLLGRLADFGVRRVAPEKEATGPVRLVFRAPDAGALASALDAWCRERGGSYRVGPVTLEEVYAERVGHAFGSPREPAPAPASAGEPGARR